MSNDTAAVTNHRNPGTLDPIPSILEELDPVREVERIPLTICQLSVN